MSLIRIEGFDHVDIAAAEVKGWDFSQSATVGSSYARFDGQGGYCQNRFDGMTLDLGASAACSPFYLGVAMKKAESGAVTGVGEGTFSNYFMYTYDENMDTNIIVCVMADYSINVYDAGGSLLGSTSAGVFPDLQWFYFEMKIVVHATAGEVVLRIKLVV